MIIVSKETFTDNEPIKTRLVLNEETFTHYHEYFEFFYVLSGTVIHSCNSTGVKQGDNSLSLLRMMTDVHSIKKENDVSFTIREISIAPKAFIQACDYLWTGLYSTIIQSKNNYQVTLLPDEISSIEKNIRSYENCIDGKEKIILAKNILIFLLSAILVPKLEIANPTYPTWFSDILKCFSDVEYLRDGLPAILNSTYINRAHVCKTFKKYMNVTMTEYLSSARIKYAEHLLTSSNESITDICFSLGFSSSSYFNKQFKQVNKLTPMQYRKANKI